MIQTKPTDVKKGKGKERATDSAALPSSLNLFHTAQPKSKSAGKQVEAESESEDESGSESDASSSSSASIPAPPKQKITLSGADPLPKSLHANLPSLVTHLPSASGQPLLNALQSSNIHSLWGVQCAVAGCILEKRDTMCVAPTGSGKTLAYVLPTLVRLQDPARSLRESEDEEERERAKGIRALVVVPTHDLAVQIEGVVKAVTRRRGWRVMVLTKATQKAVCESAPGTGVSAEGSESEGEGEDEEAEQEKEEDGESEDEETDDKKGESVLGIDILIATPERLHHLLQEGKVSLSS
jgi:ATP-dependent RNA helicase DDX52/ROK1